MKVFNNLHPLSRDELLGLMRKLEEKEMLKMKDEILFLLFVRDENQIWTARWREYQEFGPDVARTYKK